MITIAADHSEFASPPHFPKLGKMAAERRRRPLTVFFALVVAMLVLTSRSRWPASGFAREFFFVTGMGLASIGAFGRIWSNLFISGYKSKSLVMTGPYSLCRNPLYFFSAIGMIGIGLTTETVVIPTVLVLFFSAYYPMIISREERRLAERHGEAFTDYCCSTPAFWPYLEGYREPETYIMHPRAMRKNLSDAFWFVAFAAIVHAEAHLPPNTLFPQLFQLW